MEKKKISMKKKVVHLGGWQSRLEPVFAVCGANDTGNFPDSPCKTEDCHREINQAIDILKEHSIKYRTTYCQTSNVFCLARFVVVSEDDIDFARQLVQPILEETRLLYLCENN